MTIKQLREALEGLPEAMEVWTARPDGQQLPLGDLGLRDIVVFVGDETGTSARRAGAYMGAIGGTPDLDDPIEGDDVRRVLWINR